MCDKWLEKSGGLGIVFTQSDVILYNLKTNHLIPFYSLEHLYIVFMEG